MRFHKDERGFTGAEGALLATFALAIVLLAGALIRRGSEKSGEDARRVLSEGWGTPSAGLTPGAIQTPQAQQSAAAPNNAGPPAVFHLASGGPPQPPDWERYTLEHRAVQDHFARTLGAQIEVPIPGSGPNGGTGRADLVLGNEVWEVKPARPWYMDGAGQAQLNRYLENRPGSVPVRPFNNVVIPYPGDPNREIIVNSYGQPGMLYYYVRYRQPRPQPQPQPAPDPSPWWWGAGILGGGAALWWGLKILSPACGPLAPACAVIL